jgi:hypothetical protein
MNSRTIRTILFFLVAALLISGCGLRPLPELATPTSTPTQTITPTATFTASAIPSDTPTITSTPIPSIILESWDFLFAGPDYSYTYTQLDGGSHLFILSKTRGLSVVGCNLWYRVRVEGTNESGWIACSIQTQALDYKAIPDDTGELPPTPTPAATPVLPLTVHITLINGTTYDVQADFYGPYNITVTVPAGQTRVVALPAGLYDYSLSYPGILSKTGRGEWKEGHEDTWNITVK